MKVIVAAGGTYGHINPALSLIFYLKRKRLCDVVLVSPNEELKDIAAKYGVEARIIENSKVTMRSVVSLGRGILNLFKAMRDSFLILGDEKPQVVIGFGGYAAFPLVFSACFLRIPAAIHEQNVIMGRANRLLSYFVKKVFISFMETKKPVRGKKTVLTGNLLRPELERLDKKAALEFLGLEEDLFTVLVMGGSSGSHKINTEFIHALEKIENMQLQVIHLTGRDDFNFARKCYERMGFKNRVFSFSDKMSYLFSAADIIISRAGASVISEICYFKLPAILIPYPYAGAHQLENAKILLKRKQAIMIEDKNLNSQNLSSYIVDFIKNPARLAKLREGFRRSEIRNEVGCDLNNDDIPLAVNMLADELLILA